VTASPFLRTRRVLTPPVLSLATVASGSVRTHERTVINGAYLSALKLPSGLGIQAPEHGKFINLLLLESVTVNCLSTL
jgi:hypothetical protein